MDRRPTKEGGNRSRIGKQTIISGAKKLQDILGILIELTRRHSLHIPLRDKAKGREGEWRILRPIGHIDCQTGARRDALRFWTRR